ncbi:hypothetical protein MCAP1_002177 [Malassezia caprae]|uniref:BZIP domain-containing protein n=1 Tax=Malassezia caprae TaxID=1381934 RepID=A0AAF0E6Y6_9BASI|nr:hypothetical protein MCAP1_002177 [Malassezia caprae]
MITIHNRITARKHSMDVFSHPSLLSNNFDPLATGLASEPLVLKADDDAVLDHLSPRVPMLPMDEHALQPGWTDESPSLTDSLLSLDFESASGMGSTLLSSGGLSELSPLETPQDESAAQLFSPLDSVALPVSGSETSDPIQGSTGVAPGWTEKHRSSVPTMSAMKQDFTLFPSTASRGSVGGQSANSDIMSLLDTLNGQSPKPNTELMPQTTSLQEIVQPAKPCAPSEASMSPSSTTESDAPTLLRTAKRRRREVDELLPIDAPIQPRKYLTESATSRRDSSVKKTGSEHGSPSPSPLDGSQEMDARTQKRLSNTLAARRSRHRKAEELKRLYETIANLEKEAAMWKQRCEAAEKERDQMMMNRPW